MTKQLSRRLQAVCRCFRLQTFFWLTVIGTVAGCTETVPTEGNRTPPADVIAADTAPDDLAPEPPAMETLAPTTEKEQFLIIDNELGEVSPALIQLGDAPLEAIPSSGGTITISPGSSGLANRGQLTVLVPGSPSFEDKYSDVVDGDLDSDQGVRSDGLLLVPGEAPLAGKSLDSKGTNTIVSDIRFTWVPLLTNSERKGAFAPVDMRMNRGPLMQQPHRRARWLLSSPDAVVPEPITEMESFSAALDDIRTRWLAAHNAEINGYEERQFDRITSGAEGISDLVAKLESEGHVEEELIRLLGLFGDHASEAVPALVRLVRKHFENPERGPLSIDGGAQCAQALANIGRASSGEMKLLLQEGSPSEQRFAIAVVGLLGDRGSACVPELMTLLDSQDPEMANAAAWGLAAIGPEAAAAAPKFVVRLEQDPTFRSKASGALCSIGPAAVDATLKLASASDAKVRGFAATILGKIGQDSPDAAAALSRLLDDPDPKVQRATIVAIPGLGSAAESVIAKLLPYLQGPHELMAIATLGRLGVIAEEAVPQLVKIASQDTDSDSSVNPRVAALEAIAQIGQADKESVETIAGLLHNPQIDGNHSRAKISGQAAIALGALGSVAQPVVPQLIEVINNPILIQRGGRQEEPKIHVTGHRHPATLKLLALESLGKIGDRSPAVFQTCRQCLKDDDLAIRVVAVKSLSDLGQVSNELVGICKGAVEQATTDAVDPLFDLDSGLAIIGDDTGHSVLHRATQAFKALGDKSIPALIDIVNSPDSNNKGVVFAVRALGEIGHGSSDARLCLLRFCFGESDDFGMDEIKKQTLHMLGQDNEAHVETLILLLSDEPYAQAAAERLAIVGVDTPQAVPNLLDLIKSEDVNSRISSVKALSSIGERDKRVIPALLNALKDDEPRVPSEAFKGLCRIGPPVAPY